MTVPDEIPQADRRKLVLWAKREVDLGKLPVSYLERDRQGKYWVIGFFVEQCLDHHRGNGNPRKRRDWLATCRTWVRNAWVLYGHDPATQKTRQHAARDRHAKPGEAARVSEALAEVIPMRRRET